MIKGFNVLILVLFLPFWVISQSQTTGEAYRTVDNIQLNGKVFTVKTKYTEWEFLLKLCGSDSCSEPTQEFGWNIAPQILSRAVIAFAISNVDNDLKESLVTREEHANLDQLLTRVKALVELDKSEQQRLMESIDKGSSGKSGTLILNKELEFMFDGSNGEGQGNRGTDSTLHTLFIEEALVEFFNNKASTIFVRAKWKNGEEWEKINFLNNRYSVPLRAFNFYTRGNGKVAERHAYQLSALTMDKKRTISIDVNDFFDYVNRESFNYSVANKTVTLSHGTDGVSEHDIDQRGFFDFFTGVIYSDLMGVDDGNSNSLLNAQASLLVLMNQKNSMQWTATRQFLTMANIALGNSFNDETRYIGYADEETVDHFDLYRKNNLNAGIWLDLLTYESKGWFLNTSLGYKGAFYRTGFQNTRTVDQGQDVITTGQLYSIGHGPYLNFEFRPQANFGADINISLENLSYNDSKVIDGRDFGKSVLMDTDHNAFLIKHNLINLSANFYWLTSPGQSDGGVYVRLAGTYHTPTSSVFPQVFVGYATNLTSFVNKFKSDTNGGGN